MKILSIESSCDETAAALVEDGRKVLSSVVYSQIAEHRRYGGVVPEIASRRHTEQICAVTQQALDQGSLTLAQVDGVAVTAAPGLIGALLVGVNFAKSLAFAAGKPLIPVHHIRGHIAANYLAHPQLEPPFLCMVVSGGHTHIVMVEDYTTFRVLGRTRDDAAGEAFDKAARAMGFGYPGGVELDRAGKDGDPSKYSLPTPHVDGSPLDFSFSGLKTAVINLVHNASQKGEELDIPSLAASFGEKVAEIITQRLLLAQEETGAQVIALAGGVAANSRLRARLSAACKERGLPLYAPPLDLCGDNAAMIGAQAFYEYQAGHLAGWDLNAQATMDLAEQFESR
ncbi:MAG TPA: tRNA (adenosine(37)-N6)-threonylcarbamoyltransferase complex transferase subunit TsaD [Firmicutes bacterium]|nr:tRNA (adenosine(37)-N6)-threonylcarbamoyltransferase complex transferase subunit TsaD [Bacillota bacterium]